MKYLALIAVPLVLMAAIVAVNILGEQDLKPRKVRTILVQPSTASTSTNLNINTRMETLSHSVNRQLQPQQDCCTNTL